MTQAQFDALIAYINAKVAHSQGRGGSDAVVFALIEAETHCVTEPR